MNAPKSLVDKNECVQIRIVGTDLPGRDCPSGHNFPGYTNVHVGMQTRRRPPELLNLQPGDVAEVTWTIDCEVTDQTSAARTSRAGRATGSST